MSKRLSYLEVKTYIEYFDYTLLSTEYINAHTKLLVRCPSGHEYEVNFNNFKNGNRCPTCLGVNKKTIFDLNQIAKNENYIILSKEYINAHTKMKWRCPNNHYFYSSWHNFQQGYRCPVCAGNIILKIENIKNHIETQSNYKLLSTEYKNNHTKLDVLCDKGHIFGISYGNFKHGRRCPICARNNGTSKMEKEILNHVLNNYTGIIIPNDKTVIINPKSGRYLELDIWLPELKKAIEFNGTYWHSSNYSRMKDKTKMEQCKKLGIYLLVINEDGWLNDKQQCLNMMNEFIF